jgi:hypothetical protein
MKRKAIIGISLFYSIICLILAIVLFINGKHNLGLVALSGIALGLFPIGIMIFTKFELGLPLICFYILFLFGSQILGSIANFYQHFVWWDLLLHFISGILLACLAIDLYKKLLPRDTVYELSTWFIFIFIFSFSIMGGVLWEIYEYLADVLFDMNLQHGNADTMSDLITDGAGGLVVAIWVLFRSRKNRVADV